MKRDYPLEKVRNFLNLAQSEVGRTFENTNVLVGITKINEQTI